MIETLKSLYREPRSNWIQDLEDGDIPTFPLNNMICMRNELMQIGRYLDKYVFVLTNKQWLHLAWAVLPKKEMGWTEYYKKEKEEHDIYEPLYLRVRKIFDMSDNDFAACKHIIKRVIDEDKLSWFKRMGLPEEVWKQHGLAYNQIREGEVKGGKSGLELFGI